MVFFGLQILIIINMIFLFFSFLNIFILILLRFLVKKNIYIYNLAYLTVILQIIVLLISILRERNFTKISFEITFIFFLIIFSFIKLTPIAIKKLFSENKKSQIIMIENNLKSFLLEAYDNLLEKRRNLASFCEKFSNKLTVFISKIVFSNYFWLFLITPWLVFTNFFIFEILTQKFFISPYFFAYWIFFYRLIVLILYIVKNSLASFFILPLRTKIKSFWSLDFYLSLRILVTLVLNEKTVTKEEKIKNWKNFNEFLAPFVDFSVVDDIFYHQLSLFKKLLDGLNVILVFSFLVLLLFEKAFNNTRNYLLFFFIVISLSFCYFFFWKKEEIPEGKKYEEFFSRLVEFIGHFKYVLIKEHNFSLQEVDENFNIPIRITFPITFKEFFKKLVIGQILFLFIFSFFADYPYFLFICLKSFLFFSEIEPLFFIFISFEPFIFIFYFLYLINFISSTINILFFLVFH